MGELMASAVANQYNFRLEAPDNLGALIKDIQENRIKVSLAIKLGTTVEYLASRAKQIDTPSVLTGDPGIWRTEIHRDCDTKDSPVEDSVSSTRYRGRCWRRS